MQNNFTNNYIKKERIPFAEEIREMKYFNKRNVVYFCMGAIMASVAFSTYFDIYGFFRSDTAFSYCRGGNIGVIKIIGEINHEEIKDYYSVSAPKIIDQIEELENNPNIKGILVDIDSGGGTVVSTESIMLALRKSKKPSAAVIQDIGASGAYLISTGADRIFASRFSSVGSIGVTNDFLDISGQDKKNGVIFYDFSSGKYKGMIKEHNQMTAEQRSVIMEDIMKLHNILVDYVSKNRNIPKEKVKILATGRTYVGDDALKLGLIDEIGGIPEAGKWLKYTIGEEPSYCFAME